MKKIREKACCGKLEDMLSFGDIATRTRNHVTKFFIYGYPSCDDDTELHEFNYCPFCGKEKEHGSARPA